MFDAASASSGHWDKFDGCCCRLAVLDLVMGGHGADADRAFVPGDAAETGDAAQVDETLGRGQPQLHHGDEAHAAGEYLGVAFGEKSQRFLHAGGR